MPITQDRFTAVLGALDAYGAKLDRLRQIAELWLVQAHSDEATRDDLAALVKDIYYEVMIKDKAEEEAQRLRDIETDRFSRIHRMRNDKAREHMRQLRAQRASTTSATTSSRSRAQLDEEPHVSLALIQSNILKFYPDTATSNGVTEFHIARVLEEALKIDPKWTASKIEQLEQSEYITRVKPSDPPCFIVAKTQSNLLI